MHFSATIYRCIATENNTDQIVYLNYMLQSNTIRSIIIQFHQQQIIVQRCEYKMTQQITVNETCNNNTYRMGSTSTITCQKTKVYSILFLQHKLHVSLQKNNSTGNISESNCHILIFDQYFAHNFIMYYFSSI